MMRLSPSVSVFLLSLVSSGAGITARMGFLGVLELVAF